MSRKLNEEHNQTGEKVGNKRREPQNKAGILPFHSSSRESTFMVTIIPSCKQPVNKSPVWEGGKAGLAFLEINSSGLLVHQSPRQLSQRIFQLQNSPAVPFNPLCSVCARGRVPKAGNHSQFLEFLPAVPRAHCWRRWQ